MTAIISFHYNGATNPIILPRRPSSTTPDDPNRPIASPGYYSTIKRRERRADEPETIRRRGFAEDPRSSTEVHSIVATSVSTRPLLVYLAVLLLFSSRAQTRKSSQFRSLFIQSCSNHGFHRRFNLFLLARMRIQWLHTSSVRHRPAALATVHAPLLVRSLKRHVSHIRGYTVAPYSNQSFSNAFTSQQALTLSALLPHPQEIQVLRVPAFNSRDLVVCLGDTTLSSSRIPIIPTPQCPPGGVYVAILPLVSLIRLISELEEYSAPTFILPTTTSTSPASPSPSAPPSSQ
ncbi:hypothetical protein C8J56DRAFT_1173802 [Mycena floridula]|nr:hypothetical protein C8J56DRAFT_1173802 [Mycena floridula]